MNFNTPLTAGLQPQVGLQGGLMGYAPQNTQIQQGQQSLPSSVMGPWSQLAYQMAGSPQQGGLLASVAPPPLLPGTGGGSSSSGGSALTGILTGLLGSIAKNPNLVKTAYNGISGLLGGGSSAGGVGSILAGGSAPVASVGTGAIAPAVDSAGADASAALAGTPSATVGLLGSGLGGGTALAGGAGAVGSTAGAIGAGAPGVFASGSAAAGSGGAATGAGSLGLAGAAGLAAPLAATAIGLMLGDAWTGKNTQGNAAMKGWMNATGSTWKPNPGQSNSGGNTFQSQQFSSASNPGTMIGPDGKPMTGAQAANAIYTWATQNGVNPGDFRPTG